VARDGSAAAIFAGPGRTLEALRATDWAATPLGPVAGWTAELRAAIRTVLPSRIPMLLWWGRELVQIFNEAYTPVLGDKFPAAAGQAGAECWAEVWDELGPMAEGVLAGHGATYSENQLLFLRRHGYLEETYWTFSYSPVHAADGSVAGVFVATTDVTDRVLADRRLRLLRELGGLSVAATESAGDACRATLAVLARQPADIPFGLAYLRGEEISMADPAGGDPLLVGSAGVGVAGPLSASLAKTPELAAAFQTGKPARLTGLSAHSYPDPPPVAGDGAATVEDALVLPLSIAGRREPVGALVLAITPYRRLDGPYQAFLDLVASRVSAALTDVNAFVVERRRAAALTELDAAKTLFFADVSHELRTPLTLIAGPVEESLADQEHPLPAAHRRRLELARRNADRLRTLVDDLLDVARIEGRQLVAEAVPTDLPQLTAGIAEGFEFAMRRAGLRFVVDVAPLPRTAHVDRKMWEKVVVNLLSNALKYTLEGEVRLALRGTDDEMMLSVTDTGVGVPDDEQPLLFERFHRVRRGGQGRSHEGAGIGLALVHELVRLHGGSVAVRSAEGVGSTFEVRIPYGVPAARLAPDIPIVTGRPRELPWQPMPEEPILAQPAVAASGGGGTVLVVDDNPDMRAFLTGLLAPHYAVRTAADGGEALAEIRRQPPDLVLTDLMMPVLDGLELLAELRRDPHSAHLPVIVLSARAGGESAVEGLSAGADDYLVKPFGSAELLARVRGNLQLARLRSHESSWRKALTESLQDAFVIADAEGFIIEVNDAFRQLVGFNGSLPQPVPHPWWPDPETEPAEWRLAEAAARDVLGATGGRVRVPLRHATGHRIWVDVVYSSLVDDDGRRVYVLTMRDVTVDVTAAERLTATTRMATRLAEATGVEEVLAVGLAELRRFAGAQHGSVVGRGEAGEPVVLAGAWRLHDSAVRLLSGEFVDVPDGIGIPLKTGEEPTAVWLTRASSRPISEADRAQLFLLCGTFAHALTRARTYETQRTVALAMQRSILGPAELPDGFAVRYEPAVQPLEVGGDWYDVVVLAGGAIGVVVGDCVGRGLPAATVMGQLRSACRALLLQAKGPAAVLEALDDFAASVPDGRFTTVFCAIIDGGAIRYSSAGHPPALLTDDAGGCLRLDQAQSVPLATVPVNGRPEATAVLAPGCALLLYTDGLVERRGEPIDTGIDRVAGLLTSGQALPEEALADRLLGRMLLDAARDDVAVLVYRRPDPTQFAATMPADPTQLAVVRRALRRWLADRAVPTADAEAALAAAGEACANAIEHAYGFDRQRTVEITAELRGGRLEIVVRDTGGWREPVDSACARGRGHAIMKRLTDEAIVEAGPNGTTVHLVRRCDPG
jgi:PAS domain S-box-containing protein